MAPRPAPENIRERLERWPGAIIPYLLFFLTLTPFGWLRAAGWLALLGYSLGDYRWPLRLLVFSLPFTAPGSYHWFFTVKPFHLLGLLLLAGLCAARVRCRLPRFRWSLFHVLLGGFFLALALSLLNSDHLGQGFRMLANYGFLLALAAAVAGWYPDDEWAAIPRLLIAGAVAMAPFQIVNLTLGEYNRKSIPVATFEGGYTTADYLLFVLPFVALAPLPARYGRWLPAVLLPVLILDLLLTFNRSGWYAALAVALLIGWWRRSILLRNWRRLGLAAALGILLFAIAVDQSPYLTGTLYSYARRSSPEWMIHGGDYFTAIVDGKPIATEHWRLPVWKKVLRDHWRDHWLVGSGVGDVGLPVYDPPAHNNLIQVMCESGLVGAALLLLLYGRCFRRAARAGDSGFGLALRAALVGLILHGLFWNTLTLLHHWLLLAFGELRNDSERLGTDGRA